MILAGRSKLAGDSSPLAIDDVHGPRARWSGDLDLDDVAAAAAQRVEDLQESFIGRAIGGLEGQRAGFNDLLSDLLGIPRL